MNDNNDNKVRFCKRATEQGKTVLSEFNSDSLDYDKPMVLVLPGAGAFGYRKGNVSSRLKLVENMLGGKDATENKIQIFSTPYPGKLSLLFRFMAMYRNPHTAYSKETAALARDLFMPLIAQPGYSYDGKTDTLTGEKISSADMALAKKRLGNMTLFGYSAGTWISQGICNALNKYMDDLGYSTAEKKELINSVHLLSIGNTAKIIERPENRAGFSAVYITPKNDRVTRFLIPGFKKMIPPGDEQLPITHNKSGNELMLYPELEGQAQWYETRSDGTKKLISKGDEDVYKLAAFLPHKVTKMLAKAYPLYHSINLMVHGTQNKIGSQVATMIKNALNNMTWRAGRMLDIEDAITTRLPELPEMTAALLRAPHLPRSSPAVMRPALTG